VRTGLNAALYVVPTFPYHAIAGTLVTLKLHKFDAISSVPVTFASWNVFRARGMHDAWDNVVYPGMKNAVLSALLCCQDDVEHRKV